MLLTGLLLATLAAAPMKLASVGFSAVDVDVKKAEFLSDYFAQQLSSASGLDVITRSQVSTLLGIERAKALAGCEEDASCAVEISEALGADALVMGSVAAVGGELAFTLRIIGTRRGGTLASASERVGSEKLALDYLGRTAKEFAKKLAELGAGARSPSKHRLRLTGPYLTLGYEVRLSEILWIGVRGGAPFGFMGALGLAHSLQGGALVRFELPALADSLGFGTFVGTGYGLTTLLEFDPYVNSQQGPLGFFGAELRLRNLMAGIELNIPFPVLDRSRGAFATSKVLFFSIYLGYMIDF